MSESISHNESQSNATTANGEAPDVSSILAELDAPFDVLPRNAIEAARLRREEIIPGLIALIERAAQSAAQGQPVESNGHFFALFLLGELRASEALPAIVNAVALPGEAPFALFGDAIHDALPQVLAALAAGAHLDPLLTLLERQDVNEYVRWVTASALARLVAADLRPRAEIVGLLRDQLRRSVAQQDEVIVTALVCTLTSLSPQEAYDDIKAAYEQDCVDTSMIGLEEVDEAIELGWPGAYERVRHEGIFIEDTIAELEGWACFCEREFEDEEGAESEEEQRAADLLWPPTRPAPVMDDFAQDAVAPLAPLRRDPARVGRNAPCPCGSGKKFKKCCGARV